MSYQLVIFDFDGTLVDSFGFFLKHFNVLAKQHGFKLIESEAQVNQLRLMSPREIMKSLAIPMWKLPSVSKAFTSLMNTHIAEIRLFPGMDYMLMVMHAQGIRLAIASSNTTDNIHYVLGTGLIGKIEVIESGMSIFGKAVRLKKILRQSGVSIKQAIYIGDQCSDAVAAQSIGMDFAAVGWGYHRLEHLRRCLLSYEITDVHDFKKYFLSS